MVNFNSNTLTTYLDWNIFNKIEKVDFLEKSESGPYLHIRRLIEDGRLVTAYSNAHISDLARGYNKNPSFTEQHLGTITALTRDLVIVLYWGEQKVRWHYRDPKEFLES